VITETGIVVYNGVQDGDEINSRRGKLGESKIEDVAANYPGDLIFTRTGRRQSAASKTNPLPMNGAIPGWSAFNGVTDEHDSNFRLCGEARTTNQLQGMQGRALDRAFALKAGGTSTIRLISALPIAARTVLMWAVPRSPDLPSDITGRGRKLAEIKEYKPSELLTGRLSMHQLIKRQSSTPINPALLNNEEEIELSQALLFAAAVRTIAFTAVVTHSEKKPSGGAAALNDAQKIDLAILFGLVDPDDTLQNAAQTKKDSAVFQNQLIDAVFMATFDSKTMLSRTDESKAAFVGPAVDLKGGRVRGQSGNPKQKQVKRAQLMAITDITSSTATLIESRKTRIFAISLTPGRPGQDIDIFYV
jgi:hypothetical protein